MLIPGLYNGPNATPDVLHLPFIHLRQRSGILPIILSALRDLPVLKGCTFVTLADVIAVRNRAPPEAWDPKSPTQQRRDGHGCLNHRKGQTRVREPKPTSERRLYHLVGELRVLILYLAHVRGDDGVCVDGIGEHNLDGDDGNQRAEMGGGRKNEMEGLDCGPDFSPQAVTLVLMRPLVMLIFRPFSGAERRDTVTGERNVRKKGYLNQGKHNSCDTKSCNGLVWFVEPLAEEGAFGHVPRCARGEKEDSAAILIEAADQLVVVEGSSCFRRFSVLIWSGVGKPADARCNEGTETNGGTRFRKAERPTDDCQACVV